MTTKSERDKYDLRRWHACVIAGMILCRCLMANAQTPARELHPYASDKPLTEARMFAPGVVSTSAHEDSPGFERDGRTIYWEYGLPILSTIVYSKFTNGKWGEPEVAPFSGQYHDRDPFISPDGAKFFFCSRRPENGGAAKQNWDVWVMERAGDKWGEPRRLAAPINTDSDELYATTTSDGTLYFGSNREGGLGGWDLYRAKFVNGRYAQPENLGQAINSKAWDFNPSVSPDERFIIFSSQRPGGQGSINLYVSYHRGGRWTPAANLGDRVNSKAAQYHPALSPDGKYLFFCGVGRGLGLAPPSRPITYKELTDNFRSVRNNAGNIYQIELNALGIER